MGEAEWARPVARTLEESAVGKDRRKQMPSIKNAPIITRQTWKGSMVSAKLGERSFRVEIPNTQTE